MTAVEQLIYDLRNIDMSIFNDEHCKKYLEMEKQQHCKTWDTALDKYEVRAGNYMRAYEDFDDYFAETYGSKGSDEHIVDTNEMIDHIGDANKMVEISDEEIHKAATNYSSLYYEFRAGAQWYREQLKMSSPKTSDN